MIATGASIARRSGRAAEHIHHEGSEGKAGRQDRQSARRTMRERGDRHHWSRPARGRPKPSWRRSRAAPSTAFWPRSAREAGIRSELSLVFTDDAHIRRSTPAGAARTSRPTCCPFRPFRRSRAASCRRCSATSSLPPRPWRPRRRPRASRSLDHITHLIVHGVLHLIGYDHETDAEAEEMEEAERRILAGLDIPDPYRQS